MTLKDIQPVTTPCNRCPIRRLQGFRDFTAKELAFIRGWKIGERRIPAKGMILQELDTSEFLYTVLSGWAFKFKSLSDGRRQIINYALPGDLIGLQASLDGGMSYSVEALTEVTLCVLPRKKLFELFGSFAGLSFDMTWIAAREEHILGSYLLAVGQGTAFERLAFVILDLYRRALRAGLVVKNQLAFPVTQSHLADTLGMSLVHTNKTLMRLRLTGAVEWQGAQLTVRNPQGLEEISHQIGWEPVRNRPFI